MKKLFTTMLVLSLSALLLNSCAAGNHTDGISAKAGDIFIEIPTVDELTLYTIGYEANSAAGTELSSVMSAARLDIDYTSPPNAKSTLTFRGIEYSVRFDKFAKPYMRTIGYDVYFSDTDKTAFYLNHESGDIIGYMLPLDAAAHRGATAAGQDGLIATARTALSEFMDASYYSQVNVQHDSLGYSVEFYNTVCGVQMADSSTVQLCGDGTVISVIAQADPKMKAAASSCSFNTEEYNTMLDQKLAQVYPAFSCNDDKKLAEVEYSGMEIRSCLISLDDSGRPIIMYRVAPQLSYDITYRGEWAETMAANGEDVHQTGVACWSVYAAVYLTDQ